MQFRSFVGAFILTGLVSAAAVAQEVSSPLPWASQTAGNGAPAPAQMAPVPPAPVEKDCPKVPSMPVNLSHGITYITGGNNNEEIGQLKAQESEFNLQFQLLGKNGEHLHDIPLRLLDYHNFELVSAKNAGPYFYAIMHPGTYYLSVDAPGGNGSKKLEIKVPSKGTLRKSIVIQ